MPTPDEADQDVRRMDPPPRQAVVPAVNARAVPADVGEFAVHLHDLIVAGDWRWAVAAIRDWVADQCPLYRPDEIELECQWVCFALGDQESLYQRTQLPERDAFGPNPMYLTKEQAAAQFLASCTKRWAEIPGTYRRFRNRVMNPRPAEEKVLERIKNIELGRQRAAQEQAGGK